MVLINFRTGFRFRNLDFEELKLTFQKASLYAFWLDQGIRQALRESLVDYRLDKVIWSNFRETFSDLAVEEFHFKYRDFECNPVAWFPNSKSRKQFIEETTSQFWRWCKEIKKLEKHESLNEENVRKSLDIYCDKLEKMDSQTHGDFPYDAFHIDILFAAAWNPAEMSREDFIEMFVENVKIGFDKGKKMASSLASMDKGLFEASLYSYCNKVKRALPKNYAETPRKYKNSNRDFMWVVDTQVMPIKTIYEIVAEDSVNQVGTTPEAVKRAIARLCAVIGKTRKSTPRTGRPKGIKEDKTRRREK